MQSNIYDAIIIGAGHNGLVSAIYLAKAGKKVLILEKNDYAGGATTSQRVFPEFDASLSRYSYLVSLLPQTIIDELGLDVHLFQRKIASFTPYDTDKGLIISNIDESVSKQSILNLGYGETEWIAYKEILRQQQIFAEMIWDSFLKPLESKESWLKSLKNDEQRAIWEAFVEQPIGHFLDKYLQSDVLKGVMLTDAKIGSFTDAYDASLLQNRTFIYHIIGNKTGEWRVPKGGMGHIAAQLHQKAIDLGVEIHLNAKVIDVNSTADLHTVTFEENEKIQQAESQYLLWNANPIKKEKYERIDEGTAFKINMLLKKLPTLKDKTVDPVDAFAGTFHINQLASQMQVAYDEAITNKIPTTLAGEIYCHTLTDPSILSATLQAEGFHTLTYFGLDLPYSLFMEDNKSQKEIVVQRFYDGLNAYLEEPIQDCLAVDSKGNLCIEAKSSLDLEAELGLPRGNIFQSELSWFFAENEAEIGTMGVETAHPKIFICGSSAKRGGAVSGIPGRNAAMKVLTMMDK
jgi:phytoene dehydrogenase-like protein